MNETERGHADAAARREASSVDPDYLLGYADGVYERRQATAAVFTDVTIDGDKISVTRAPGESRFVAQLNMGSESAAFVGRFGSMEEGVTACLDTLRKQKRSAVRMGAIHAHIEFSHPELSHDDQQRIASRVASYIQEHRKR